METNNKMKFIKLYCYQVNVHNKVLYDQSTYVRYFNIDHIIYFNSGYIQLRDNKEVYCKETSEEISKLIYDNNTK